MSSFSAISSPRVPLPNNPVLRSRVLTKTLVQITKESRGRAGNTVPSISSLRPS
jgi:hypothetical protein